MEPVGPGRRAVRGSMRIQEMVAARETMAVARGPGVRGFRVSQARAAEAMSVRRGRRGQKTLCSKRAMRVRGKRK